MLVVSTRSESKRLFPAVTLLTEFTATAETIRAIMLVDEVFQSHSIGKPEKEREERFITCGTEKTTENVENLHQPVSNSRFMRAVE